MSRDEKVRRLSAAICRSKSEGTEDVCAVCSDYGECRIAEKTDEQLDYVLSSAAQSVFLQACPGSGKTEVIGLKAAYEINRWSDPGGIAVLTFTNNAADVISDRVSCFAGVDKLGFPHFVGTIDSWLHGYVGHPFAHLITNYDGVEGDRSLRLIDNSSNANFLNNFKTVYGFDRTGKPSANQFVFDYELQNWIFNSGNRGLDQSRSAIRLQDWQVNDLETTKNKFLKAGFVTYQDVENICMKLLVRNDKLAPLLAKRFPLIIVDECQDLSAIQLIILEALKAKGVHLHFVGDLQQAIYEFKQVDPLEVKEFAERLAFVPMPLTKNFRSCQPVIDLCQRLVTYGSPVETEISQEVDTPCVCVSYPKNKISDLPKWFSDYVGSKSLDSQKCKIVTRGWSNVAKLRATGRQTLSESQLWLAAAIGLWVGGDKQSLPEAISLVGRFITKSYLDGCVRSVQNDYCPEGVKSRLEWRLFLANVLDKCCQDAELSDLDKTWSDWASAVRASFSSFVDQAKSLLTSAKQDLVIKLGQGLLFRSLSRRGDESVRYTFQAVPAYHSDIKITTIHDVKGETLDAVMVVSSTRKTGKTDGYWEQWLEDQTSEAARLAYVASSRPQHLLVWAVPEINDDQIKRLEGLGFSCQGIE